MSQHKEIFNQLLLANGPEYTKAVLAAFALASWIYRLVNFYFVSSNATRFSGWFLEQNPQS
jgi:hypothetical protein